MDTKEQKQFKQELNINCYLELTKLEELQVELEKKLHEEKRNIMRNHLIKTIDDNKHKIAQKKEEIRYQKLDEKEKMKLTRIQLEDEKVKEQQEKFQKKITMKEQMSRQLLELNKKKEDA